MPVTFDDLFADVPLMAILRGMGVERSLELSIRAWDLGSFTWNFPCRPTPTSRP